jgi:ABC-type uncharacterized transport system ATPase component
VANEQNLRPKPFTSENQPARNGRKKGVPNRATVYKRILQAKTNVKMPDGETKELTVYEAIALGQARSAMKGNTNAWKEIQDTLHGKMADKVEQTGDITHKVIVEFEQPK